MLAADYGAWPFKNPPHSITAAQRTYIAATREEHNPKKSKESDRLPPEQLSELIERSKARKDK